MPSFTDRARQTRDNIFTLEDPKDFGLRIAAKMKEWGTLTMGTPFALHYGNVGVAYTHLYGLDIEGVGANAAVVTRSGEQGSIAELRIPTAGGDLRKIWNLIVGPELAWTAVATTTDYASGAKAITAKNALQYYWTDKGVGSMAKGMAFEALAFGEAGMHIPWNDELGDDLAPEPIIDPRTQQPVIGQNGEPEVRMLKKGDIDFRPVSTWDIIRDPTCKSFDALQSIIIREWQNRYDVAARCEDPDAAEAALTAAYLPAEIYRFWRPFNPTNAVQSDLIPVYFLYHKVTGACRDGRMTEFLDTGHVIRDGKLAKAYRKHWPFVRMAAGEYSGTPFPYSKWVGTLGSAQAEDALTRDLLTNATATSGGIIIAEEDSNTPPLQLGGGPKVLYVPKGTMRDHAEPKPLQLQQSHPEHFKLKSTLASDRRSIIGLDRLTAGEEIGATWSGAMAALVTSTSVQNNSQEQAGWGGFVQGIGNVALSHIHHHMKEPRKIALAGKARADLVITTELSGDAVEGVDRLQVQLAPALQQTDAGKMQLGEVAIKQGWAQTPQQLQSVFDTGRLDALTQDLSNELMLIQGENEALSKGEKVKVMLGDDHLLHLRGHRPVTASVTARRTPAVVIAMQEHEAQHIKILQETDPNILKLFNQPSLAPAPEVQPEGPSEATKLGATQLAVKQGWAQTPADAQKVFESGKLDAAPGAPPGAPPGVPQGLQRPVGGPAVQKSAGNPAPGSGVAPQQQAKAVGPTLPKNPQTGQQAGPVAGTVPPSAAMKPRQYK